MSNTNTTSSANPTSSTDTASSSECVIVDAIVPTQEAFDAFTKHNKKIIEDAVAAGQLANIKRVIIETVYKTYDKLFLLKLIREGKWVFVEYIIDSYTYYANDVDNNGQNALHLLVKAKQNDLVEKIIPNYAMKKNINDVDGFGNTALIISVIEQSNDIFMMLLEHSDVNVANNNGNTALSLSLKFYNFTVVEKLAKKTTNFQKNDQGLSPLMAAVYLGRDRVLPILWHSYCKDDKFANTGDNLLHTAVKSDYYECAKFLAEKCDNNETNDDGHIPIFYAVSNGNWKMIELLLPYVSCADDLIEDIDNHILDESMAEAVINFIRRADKVNEPADKVNEPADKPADKVNEPADKPADKVNEPADKVIEPADKVNEPADNLNKLARLMYKIEHLIIDEETKKLLNEIKYNENDGLFTPLMFLAEKDDCDDPDEVKKMVLALLKKYDPNFKDANGKNALIYAILSKNNNMIKILAPITQLNQCNAIELANKTVPDDIYTFLHEILESQNLINYINKNNSAEDSA